jgi:hypothetical protein
MRHHQLFNPEQRLRENGGDDGALLRKSLQ